MTNLRLLELADAQLPEHESLSPFCIKAHRALRVAGLRYDRVHANRPDAHKAHNPTGQVPVLLVEEGNATTAIADSSAILAYVARQAPARLDRSPKAIVLEEYGDTALAGFLTAARWADDDNWPRTRQAYFGAMPKPIYLLVPPKLRRGVVRSLVARDIWRAGPEACWRCLHEQLDALDAEVPAQGFWCGERISVGDIAVFAPLWSLCTPLTPLQGQWVQDRSRLWAWLLRMQAATSVARA